ncbi:MAG TPA: type II methionyl aminopeptidase [Methanolinea sp.]|jgi:methionyl aminopeptidase|nr:type II methionyl aminopeptidase [Methanolinea sp.]
MKDEVMDKYIEAGKIASEVRRKGAGEIRVGASYLAVVDTIEEMVRDAGAGLAFPLNVSLNEDAAHDTASAGDERVFAQGDVVKLDLGVHVDGYIADTAMTVDLGDHPLLVEASARGLASAISMVAPGVTVGELGSAIHEEIESRGFRPVANLTGHGLDRYRIHTPPNIPNIRLNGGAVLEEGMVFAIEPFASTGIGQVSEKHRTEIYQQLAVKPVRLPSARRVLEEIRQRQGMPFSRRWLNEGKLDLALSTLVRSQVIRAYPVLSDVPGSLVSQAEHTLIVTSEGCLVTTA